ncbi:MAG: hypothetical protein SF066_23695 [Thermoanaerobaculia bacterium]|nr:hypothetical protein [Thermoanaerobaculia bacterium]
MIPRSVTLLWLLILLPWARGEAQCSDLAALAEAAAPAFESLEGCERDFKPDHEAVLTGTLERALRSKDKVKVEAVAGLWQRIHGAYLGQKGFKSDSVLAALARSVRSPSVQAALGALQPAFRVAPTGESLADSVSYLLHVAERLRPVSQPPGGNDDKLAPLGRKVDEIEKQLQRLPDRDFWWISSLGTAGLALLLAGAALWRSRRSNSVPPGEPLPPPPGEVAGLSKKVLELEEKLTPSGLTKMLSGILQESENSRFPALVALHQGLENLRTACSAEIGDLVRRLPAIESFGERLTVLEQARPSAAPSAPPIPAVPAANPLAIVQEAELTILRAVLTQVTGGSPSPWPPLLDELAQLPAQLEAFPELQAASQAAVAPVRGQIDLGARLRVAQKLVDGSAQRLEPAKELLRLRDTIQALAPLRPPRSAPEWSPEAFVEGGFRDFADLFHQTLQRERFEGRGQRLAGAAETVRKTLAAAGLEILEIELGRDLFDPARHVGRGTSRLANLQDGAISGVVRNGFRRVPDGAVMQLPEVIVNRNS